MAGYVPDQTDILLRDLDASASKETIKRRPALGTSRQSFNGDTGFSIVASITNTVRGLALETMQGTATARMALMHQLRSLYVADRNVSFVEKSQTSSINEAMEIAITAIR